MANLPESATWSDDLFQLETTTPARGGINGEANSQAKTLGNRTQWLRERLLALTAEVAAARGNYPSLADRLAAGDGRLADFLAPPAVANLAAVANSSGTYGSSTITLSASIHDLTGLANVAFYVDGAQVKTFSNGAQGTLSADVSAAWFSNGSHTFMVRALNLRGISARASTSFNVANSGTPTPPPNIVVDTVPPVIQSLKVDGTSGLLTLICVATDDVGLGNAQFTIDGADAGTASRTTLDTAGAATFTRNVRAAVLTNGAHTLSAQVWDAAGNTVSAAPISFTVSNPADTTAPTISSVQAISASGWLTINVSAYDDQAIAKVEYYLDGNLVGTQMDSRFVDPAQASTTAWTAKWDEVGMGLVGGTHSIVVKAYDYANNVATSPAITIQV